jgi:hypothetical protein
MNIYDEFGETPNLLSKLGELYDAIKQEVEGKVRGEINMDMKLDYTRFYPTYLVEHLNAIKEK